MHKTPEQQLEGWITVRNTWQASLLLGRARGTLTPGQTRSRHNRIADAKQRIEELQKTLAKVGA